MDDRLNIIQIFASPGWGGGEKYAHDLACELVRHGHRVTAVSRPSEVIAAKCTDSGIPHRTLPLKGVADAVSALKLSRTLRQNKADIIHVHNFKDAFTAVYANRLADGKACIVLTRHLVRRGKDSPLYRWLYRSIDAMIFVSELARQEFLSGAGEKYAYKTEVIYNSVPGPGEAPLNIPDLRERFGIGSETFLVGFTGRITPEKGPDKLIEAVGSLTERKVAAVFIGAGDTAYIEQLRILARSCGAEGRVFFYGYADNVYDLIKQVDAGVAPSVAREAFCLSAIEYMGSGKPVVTTDNGAQREYINDGENGLLVPAGNAEMLAAAIGRLASDGALREKLSSAGRRTFSSLFGYDTFYRRIASTYFSILHPATPARRGKDPH